MSLLLLFPDLGTPTVEKKIYATANSSPKRLDWYVEDELSTSLRKKDYIVDSRNVLRYPYLTN